MVEGKPVEIQFNKDKLGLIIRGKKGPLHNPGHMEQHADCILGSGIPVGFFGAADPESYSGNESGLNLKGDVYYDRAEFIANRRPFYVDRRLAEEYGVISTVLIIDANPSQVSKFKEFWEKLNLTPGGFDIVGANCSTHATEAFTYAGVIPKRINSGGRFTDRKGDMPGLDTPDNLYSWLKLLKPSSKSYSGYVGFKGTSSGYTCVVEPV